MKLFSCFGGGDQPKVHLTPAEIVGAALLPSYGPFLRFGGYEIASSTHRVSVLYVQAGPAAEAAPSLELKDPADGG
jgi:hypothetical protein